MGVSMGPDPVVREELSARRRPTWAEYALDLAAAAAKRSQDPWAQVGAVVLAPDKHVAGVGYNGPPRGVELDWADRDKRRAYVIHAEINALRYTTPAVVAGGLVAATHIPCPDCVKNIAAYGIQLVAYSSGLDWGTYDRATIFRVAETCGITLKSAEEL